MYVQLGLSVAMVLVAMFVMWQAQAIIFVANNRVAVLEKRFSAKGAITSGFIALHGEAGYQPQILRGGLHFLPPFVYKVHRMPLVAVSEGSVAYVFARDGLPLQPGQALASNATARDFTDVKAFLAAGGQKGVQRMVLRAGVHAINGAQFAVLTSDETYGLALTATEAQQLSQVRKLIEQRHGFAPFVLAGEKDDIGVVTVHEGADLPPDQVIAPTPLKAVGPNGEHDHKNYQDADVFIAALGYRGRQWMPLLDGTYYINALFATVERIAKTTIAVGNVGVVVSYTGAIGDDVSGSEYRHGSLVESGSRGVQRSVLGPGKYAFNTYAGSVQPVPTTNIILKWIEGTTGEHKLDENLTEIRLITKDGFEPTLPLSVVVHVDYEKAPYVIQRFGDVKQLIEQSLDPLVSAYFKNIGQTMTLLELLQNREAVQKRALDEMRPKFDALSLALVEVMFDTPRSDEAQQMETMLKQIRDRQIAREQVETYAAQRLAQGESQRLQEAQTKATAQQDLTKSAVQVEIATNVGKAKVQEAMQEAERIGALARAEADKVKVMGAAEAERVRSVGLAQADVTAKQVEAAGGPTFLLQRDVMLRWAQAVETGKIPLVPSVAISGNGGTGGSGLQVLEGLMAMSLSDRMGLALPRAATPEPATPEPVTPEPVTPEPAITG